MRDVYAGDDDQGRATTELAPRSDVLFVVQADADPDALARIAGVISLANLAPTSGSILTGPSGRLTVSLEVRGVAATAGDLIRRKLLQLTCVTAAEALAVSRSPAAAPAGAGRE